MGRYNAGRSRPIAQVQFGGPVRLPVAEGTRSLNIKWGFSKELLKRNVLDDNMRIHMELRLLNFSAGLQT